MGLTDPAAIKSSTFSHKDDTHPEGGVARRDAHEDTIELGVPQTGAVQC